MKDKKSVESQDEKSEVEVEETKEEVAATDVAETEVDPYEAELNRLAKGIELAELKEKQKSGALKEEREKNQALEKRNKELEGNDIDPDKMVDKLRHEIGIDNQINARTSNPNEIKLIREYMKLHNLDVESAWILANKNILVEAKRRNEERVEEESVLARISGTNVSNNIDTTSPIFKAAESGLSEKEKKHLRFDD